MRYASAINTPQDYFEVCVVFTALAAAILVPFIWYLRPSPRSYAIFIRDTWNVRVHHDAVGFKWLPHYFSAVFISFFIGQAVHSTLHYPLLVDHLGASVLQVGYLDAASAICSACTDLALRASIWKGMSRRWSFLLGGLLNGVSYIVIIGYMVPSLAGHWQLVAVFFSETLAGLNLTFQEFAVMRNDWNSDIVLEMKEKTLQYPADELDKWTDSEKVGLKLGQLMVVLRYPATIAATSLFGTIAVVNDTGIYTAYIVVGVISSAQGMWLAWSWRNHKEKDPTASTLLAQPEGNEASPTSRKSSNEYRDMAGPYFTVACTVGLYNAALEVTRRGYVRLLNLRTITLTTIDTKDISILLSVTFGISWAFFWLADTASHEASTPMKHFKKMHRRITAPFTEHKLRVSGKTLVGVVSFMFMSIGHIIMGVSDGFFGMLCSAVFFGLGQATSTGLRTVLKDDIRTLLRNASHEETYRKRFMRMLSGIATCARIVSSLIVGYVGNYSLKLASFVYGGVAILGLLLAFVMDVNIRHAEAIKEASERDMDASIPTEEMPNGFMSDVQAPLLGGH